MAMFKVTVQLIETSEVDIAIEANSLEEALKYAKGTDEYLDDYVFDYWAKNYSKKGKILELMEVNEISDIRGYDSNSKAWNTNQ